MNNYILGVLATSAVLSVGILIYYVNNSTNQRWEQQRVMNEACAHVCKPYSVQFCNLKQAACLDDDNGRVVDINEESLLKGR